MRAGGTQDSWQGVMHCRDRGKCAITGRAFSAAPWPPKPGFPPSRQLCPCSPLTFLHLMLTHRQLPLAGSDPYCQKTFSATAPIMSVPELTAGKQKGKGYTKTRVLGWKFQEQGQAQSSDCWEACLRQVVVSEPPEPTPARQKGKCLIPVKSAPMNLVWLHSSPYPILLSCNLISFHYNQPWSTASME